MFFFAHNNAVYIRALNNAIPNCNRPYPKKAAYKIKCGEVINRQTGEKIGGYAHEGSPDRGERACKVNGKLVSYRPLGEPALA